MKTKVYGNMVREVTFNNLQDTLDQYGKDGYKIMSVVQHPTRDMFLLFFAKEYIEND